MIRCLRTLFFLFLAFQIPHTALPESTGEAPDGTARVVRIVVDGPISPVSADYIQRHIEKAADEDADLLVLQLDTPGGLVTSTRQIVKSILGSSIPVAVHVAPPGARAASAGVFITMAGHIAAMAPGTNIGAAHPVNVGGGNPLAPEKEERNNKGESGKEKEGNAERTTRDTDQDPERQTRNPEQESEAPASDDDVMAQKVLNDTVAFARSIADKQGRNADWAERAVRESVSVTETRALELNVVDIVAEDIQDLLEAADGRTVTVSGEEIVLRVLGGAVEDRPMGFRHRILMALSNPNIAYILMLLGIYGIFFELSNPGAIFPGVLGGIFLVLAFFSFQVIPINYAGILLILVAVILFILELNIVSYGMLSIGGIASLFLGSIMLFDTAEPYYRISISLVLSMTAFTAIFFLVGLGMAVRVQRKRPTTGMEGLLGGEGVATSTLDPEGTVKIRGEIWKAESDEKIERGSKVRVKGVKGMLLTVEIVQDAERGTQDAGE